MLGLSIFSSAVVALVCLTDSAYAGRELTGVRLVDTDGGYTSNEGTIEFMVTDGTTSTWETMCGAYLGADLAGDICRFLGFPGVTDFIHTGSSFPNTPWPPTISLSCGSDPVTIEDCTLLAIPSATSCTRTLAAIICSVATTTDGTSTTHIESTDPPIMASSTAPSSTAMATATSTIAEPAETASSSTTMATTTSTTASPTTTTETESTTTTTMPTIPSTTPAPSTTQLTQMTGDNQTESSTPTSTSTMSTDEVDKMMSEINTMVSPENTATTTSDVMRSTSPNPATTMDRSQPNMSLAVIVGPAAGGAVVLILLIVLTVVAVRKCRSNKKPGRVKVVHDRDSWAMYNDNDDNLYHMPDEDHATNNSSQGVVNTVAQHFPEDVNGLYASVDETGPNDMKNIPLHNMYAKPKKEKKSVATGYGDLYAKPSKARPEPEGGEISGDPSYFVLERDSAPAPAPVPGPGPRGSTIKPAEGLRVALPAEKESYSLPMDKHRASREYDSTNMVENELYN